MAPKRKRRGEPKTLFSLSRVYEDDDLAYLPHQATMQPPSTVISTVAIFLAVIVFVVCFVVFVPWIQTVPGHGKLIALDPADNEQAVSALVPGRIKEWYVRKGDMVEKDQLIATILDNDPRLVSRLQDQLRAAQSRLDQSEVALATAKLDARRKDELYQDGLVSRLDLEQAQIKVAEFDIKMKSAVEDVNRAEVAIGRQGQQEVRAPRAGIITQVLGGGPATYVAAGTPLVRFIPANIEIVAELFIDGRDIPLVSPGEPVQMQFEGWPAFQFSGWPDVSIGGFTGEVMFVDPLAQANGRFRALVKPAGFGNRWPSSEKLRLGTKVVGWVLLEEVPVVYELWRRLNNFPPEFPAGSAQATADASDGGA